VGAVVGHFGGCPHGWVAGTRCDDAGRAAAAYVARRHYGYSAAEVARALGYRGHGSVGTAVSRIESGTDAVRRGIAKVVRELANV
jgi:hypothetical protein